MSEFTVELTEVREEAHDVKSFRFIRPEGLDFIPGQYCTIAFLDRMQGESRPFTFSTSPTKMGFFELTIKLMGDFTDEIYKTSPGDKLILKGPNGESLNFDETVKEDVVFIAGGSGITPFMSAIRYWNDKQLKNNIVLMNSNRTINDIIFRDELENLDQNTSLIVANTLSDIFPDDWTGERGIITREMIEKYVQNPEEKLWYICGPPGMIDAMKKILLDMGIPEDRMRIEDWRIPGKSD